MNPTNSDEQPDAEKAGYKPAMKVWNKPLIRDQSIRSLTEGKAFANPTEASPATGS
ncbi:hypothetical protein [Radicibacter daui]|uniref:hypothetical protein n=1 Tax=Radicibacter daui TaxID=3064829 RepID=UPI004046AA7C